MHYDDSENVVFGNLNYCFKLPPQLRWETVVNDSIECRYCGDTETRKSTFCDSCWFDVQISPQSTYIGIK